MDDYQNDRFEQDPFGSPEPTPPTGGHEPQRPRRKMSLKTKGMLKVVALCLVCALIGGFAQPVAHLIGGGGTTTIYTGDRQPTQVTTAAVDTSKELTTAEIYANYVESCVGITVDIVSTNIFGQTVTGAAAGSGFVITEDGYILTNYHVISGANSITVAFSDGKTYPATLVGGEEANDIAVIKIDATGLKPVVIGSSSDMLVGEQVTTIGNPLGELTFSESTGIISAVDRTITMSDGAEMNMIQTDCAINSGNSGGPLFNSHGEVIGIVSAKYSSGGSSSSASVEGLGFAIPMDDVAQMVSELVQNGYVSGKPLLGLIGDQQNGSIGQDLQAYGIPAGTLVAAVTPDLPAAKAGIQAGDIITKFGDADITSWNDLVAAKNSHKPGDKVDVVVYRSGQTLTLTVTLGESTPESDAKQQKIQEEYAAKQKEAEQQQQQQQGNYSWPFGSWGYGN